jgi:O-antigen ligase
LLGIAERLTGTRNMYWLFNVRPGVAEAAFFSSFIYAGHAAAWLMVAAGAALGCLLRAVDRKSALSGCWGGVFLLTIVTAALLHLALYLSVAALFVAGACVLVPPAHSRGPSWLRILLKLLMVVVLGGLAVANLITSERSVDPRNPSIAVRYAIARTSAGMIRDEPWWGYGPGSYRFVAPYYLKRNPLFTAPGHADVLRYSANYAHSDWVQIPAEWGVAGAVLFAAVLAWWAGKVWRLRRALPADSWCVIAPVALVLFAAALDFPTYNPAVLVVLAGALASAVKLGEIAGRARTGTA